MANIWGKAISNLAGNLNFGHRYLITTLIELQSEYEPYFVYAKLILHNQSYANMKIDCVQYALYITSRNPEPSLVLPCLYFSSLWPSIQGTFIESP